MKGKGLEGGEGWAKSIVNAISKARTMTLGEILSSIGQKAQDLFKKVWENANAWFKKAVSVLMGVSTFIILIGTLPWFYALIVAILGLIVTPAGLITAGTLLALSSAFVFGVAISDMTGGGILTAKDADLFRDIIARRDPREMQTYFRSRPNVVCYYLWYMQEKDNKDKNDPNVAKERREFFTGTEYNIFTPAELDAVEKSCRDKSNKHAALSPKTPRTKSKAADNDLRRNLTVARDMVNVLKAVKQLVQDANTIPSSLLSVLQELKDVAYQMVAEGERKKNTGSLTLNGGCGYDP